MATTTNYSWTTPDDTALVKDGAAAIRSLGTAIDTTVFNNAGAAIAKTIVDAKGDLIVGTAADTVARLASSASNGDLLTVDTSTASGLKWAAPAGGGKVLQVVQATYGTEVNSSSATYVDAGISCSITPSSASSKVLVLVSQPFAYYRSTNAAGGFLQLVRGATSIYETTGIRIYAAGTSPDPTAMQGSNIQGISYLDSPATTSSTTYKMQMRVEAAGSTPIIEAQFTDYGASTATMILLEIGA